MHSRGTPRFLHLLPIHAALALLLLGGPGHAVHAQASSGIRLTARVGFDGYCKQESWVPVKVTLENTGPDITGRVQASYENSGGGRSIYAADISLPTTSRKELFLYVRYPAGLIRKLNLSLVAEGTTLAETDLSLGCLSAENLIIGLVSDDPSAFDILNEVKPLRGFTRLAQLQLADLPDQAQGWAALDALVVAGADTGTLSVEQGHALATWLAQGGRLMVMGGPQWQSAAAGLKELLPIELSSSRIVAGLPALQSYFREPSPLEGETILAAGRMRADADVLVEQDGLPILSERPVGFGKVIYLAADPSLQPLSDWPGMPTVYSTLLGPRPIRPEWAGGVWEGYMAQRALSSLSELNLPSFVYICGWLIFYVAVIGPLNFLFLRRTRRRERAWLTIPLIALVFSGAAYFYGSVYRGQHALLNRIALVQAWQGSDMAEAHALVGLYSPRRAKYTLEADEGFMLYPFETDNLQIDAGWLSLQQDEKILLPEMRVEIGGMQAVAAQGSLPALKIDHTLAFGLSEKDPMLGGTITNLSSYTLHDCILITSGRWQKLGDLAPGASTKAAVSLTPDRDGPGFYDLSSEDILGATALASDDQDVRRRAAILDALLDPGNGYGYGANLGNWGVYLMGWVDAPLLPVVIQGQAFDTIDTTLYMAMLAPSVRYGPATWKLSPGLLAWESSLENASPYHSDEIPSGGYILRFRPAIPVHFSSVEGLVLQIQTGSAVTPQEISAALWDYESRAWVTIPDLYWGLNDIPQADRYLGPGGEIQLKISGAVNDYIQIDPSSFTLVVKP